MECLFTGCESSVLATFRELIFGIPKCPVHYHCISAIILGILFTFTAMGTEQND